MNTATALLALLLVSAPAYAQQGNANAAKEPRQPTAKQQAQRDRMKSCNAKAADRKGEDRRRYMADCLSGEEAAAKPTAQQQKMKDCNTVAGERKLKGDERKRFMSTCLKS